MKKFNLHNELLLLARSWPRPNGELVYFIEDDHVWLHKIRLPAAERGLGTQKMALFLSLTDKAGLPVCLTADPVDDDEMPSGSEPTTYDLVKWYSRFGFVSHGPSEDGFLMERAPKGQQVKEILDEYHRNKKNGFLSHDEFDHKWEKKDQRKLGF